MTQTQGNTRYFPRYCRSLRVSALLGTILVPILASAGEPAPVSAAGSATPKAAQPPNVGAATTAAAPPAAVSTPQAAPAAPAPSAAPAPEVTTAPAPPTSATTVAPAPTEPAPAPTFSQEQLQTAQAEIAAGDAEFKAGNFGAAEQHFTIAINNGGGAIAAYWQAMSLDLGGKTPEAIDAFSALTKSTDFATLPEDKQTIAQQRLGILLQIPGTLVVNVTPEGATLNVDGQPQAGAGPFTLKLADGKHVLSVSAEGYDTQTLEIVVKAARALEHSVALEALPAPAPAAAEAVPEAPEPLPPAPPPSKIPAYVTLGVAGASAIVGGIFGVQALGAKKDFDGDPTAAHADDVERNALIADMAFGVAITLGITGVVLLTTEEPQSPEARARPDTNRAKLEVSPYVGRASAGASARLTF